MKKYLCLFVLSNVSFASAEIVKEKDQFCQSSKEYITVYRYLEAQKVFSLKKDDIMKMADVASKGCTGAAKRFIETNELLIKAGLTAKDALKISSKFTDKSDQATETFLTIFKESFLKEYLDIDLKTSIDFALKLSLETEGDSTMIKNDFQKIVKFCTDHNGLDLSGAKCSELAGKVAASGAKFKLEMNPTFLQHFDFLTDKSGVDLPTYKALEISLKLIDSGPLSVVNFKDAYKFALSKTGLDLAKNEAINYAEVMAQRSKLETGTK
jgi:hypothetical protein